jgi:hypothetical protein
MSSDNIVEVGGYKYHVVERSPFEFYIRTDMIQNVDIENDSSLVITQLSDYIFETITTTHYNGGKTEERFLVKSTSQSELDDEDYLRNNSGHAPSHWGHR